MTREELTNIEHTLMRTINKMVKNRTLTKELYREASSMHRDYLSNMYFRSLCSSHTKI